MKIAAKLIKMGYFFNTVCKNVNLIFCFRIYNFFNENVPFKSLYTFYYPHCIFKKSNI